MQALRTRLLQMGDAYIIGAHAPLLLRDPERAWWIEDGTVDIFAVEQAAPTGGAGETGGIGADQFVPGPREHLYRVESGQLFFGIAHANLDPGWTLIGSATAGAKVREFSWRELRELAADERLHRGLTELIDTWVSATTRGAAKDIQPKNYVPLSLGQETPTAVAGGRSFSPAERLAYMRMAEGEASFLSRAALRVGPATPLLPLRDDAWCDAVRDCSVHALAPGAALREADFWDGLRHYYRLIVCFSLAGFAATAKQESGRMRMKSAQAAEQMHSGLASFVRTLKPDQGTRFADISGDPLLGACQLIGMRMATRFVAPPHTGLANADPLEAIADAARVRFRQVALRGAWWRSDGGDLLARFQENKQPLALLRVRGCYELHDPVAMTVRVVDEALAGQLAPFATSFFRSLPTKKLRMRDIAHFIYAGMGSDAMWMLGLGLSIGLLSLLTPLLTGYIFDILIPSSDRGQVAQLMGALMAVAIATTLFTLARSMAALRLETRADSGLEAAIWDRALNLPATFFKQYSSGDLAARLGAINTIRSAISGTTLGSILTGVFSLLNIALLFYYDTKLATLAVILVLGAALLSFALGFFTLRYQRRMVEISGTLSGLVLEYLRGAAKLRVTGSEARAFANWAREFSRMKQLAFGAGHVKNINDVFFSAYGVVTDILLFGAIGFFLFKAGGAPITGQDAVRALTTGQFIAFYGAFGAVMGAVTGLSHTALGLLGLIPVYERAKPVLEALPETDEAKAHPGEMQGQLDVVNAVFRYRADGPPILDDVSFSIRPGGFIAVVGASGSGKSSLLRCLLGFEKLSSGGIFFDNQNLDDLDLRAVRRQMGVVLQHSQLMPGDIFTNIVGTSLFNIDDAWEAARFCGLEDDIKAMPMGMHTMLSEDGGTLSGGQRQRILIARAIVHRPRIIFFDEATSALDNRTQDMVTQSLNQLRATRIVIAHRLSTVINADRIIVMDKGRIVQVGNYQALIGVPGIFQDLARRQML
ncbi:MAG: NHLP bacteriocin export ABC transporter permease/ATPase subunit [Nitrosomonadales bacterium]|nr:NHLP bacteriocin export ABC transporter permease/ATPase subunit [Nitrosomonadales bacterium]